MDKAIFDRAKLEAVYRKIGLHQEVTKEDERLVEEELERCKDPYYFYMNYYIIDGQRPTLTKEEFDKRLEDIYKRREPFRKITPSLLDHMSVLQKEYHLTISKIDKHLKDAADKPRQDD